MFTRDFSETIKRICIVVMVMMVMVVSTSGKATRIDYTIKTINHIRDEGYTTTKMVTPFITKDPTDVAEIIMTTITPMIAVATSSNVEKIENVVPEIIEPVAPEVTMEMIEPTVEVISEPIVTEPVIVSIEYPIGNEIHVTSTYDFSSVPLSDDLMQATIDHCIKFGIPIPIALGLMDVESDFITTAGSQSGCYGLMQLHHKYFNVYTEPAQQIHDGLEYLANNLEKCDGDIMLALNIYNAGHITGNMNYSNAVMNDASKWAEITGAPLV